MNQTIGTTESPVSFVIFGASGDLAHRKLIPALFNLFRKKRLPEWFYILGYAINDWQDADFRKSLREGVGKFADYQFTEEEWDAFANHLAFLKGDFSKPEDFAALNSKLQAAEQGVPAEQAIPKGAANQVGRVYYLATPPPFFPAITHNLGQQHMLDEKEGFRRVVIEKPFGSDLTSAQKLNNELHEVLKESQIFRIDHYLGKETVQNLLVFRFANTFFEPVWNAKYIDQVQITVAEEVGVGHRAGYYEHAGVLRDMFQNHILQLLTLLAIEPPSTMKHQDLHARKIEVIKALRPITGEDVKRSTVRGQYEGYRQEPGVDPNSQTPTYGALRVFIDNKRWQGVPFYLRSGKSLNRKVTEVVIQFKCPPWAMVPLPASEDITQNVLAICIQPDEGIYLRFEAKVPDTEADMRSVEMEFHYSDSFGPSSIPEAYERLILEIFQGDHTLFTQDDTTELAWKWIDPIIAAWTSGQGPALQTYAPGSWGPEAAEDLVHQDNCQWIVTCGSH